MSNISSFCVYNFLLADTAFFHIVLHITTEMKTVKR